MWSYRFFVLYIPTDYQKNRYTASLALHRSIYDLSSSESVSENELRLVYRISPPPSLRTLTISLIFEPTTRTLAAVQVLNDAREELDLGDTIHSHVQGNIDDVHGVVAAVLAWVKDEVEAYS